MDRQVLHVLPQQYVVDIRTASAIRSAWPTMRPQAKVHIVTMRLPRRRTSPRSNRCNLQVADIVLESLASARPCSRTTRRSSASRSSTSAAARAT